MFRRATCRGILAIIVVIATTGPAFASIFRAVTISYRNNHAIPNCVTFTIVSSFLSASPGSPSTNLFRVAKSKDGPFGTGASAYGPIHLGDWVNLNTNLNFRASSGTSSSVQKEVIAQVTWFDSTGAGMEGTYFVATSTFDFQYPPSWANGFTATVNGAARLSTLMENNNDLSYGASVAVYPMRCDSSPTVRINPSLLFTTGRVNTCRIPVDATPGYTTRFKLAPTSESGLARSRPCCGCGACTQLNYETPSGICGNPLVNYNSVCMKLDSTTGIITWNPQTAGIYAVSFKVSSWDNRGVTVGTIPVELLIDVKASWPDYTPVIGAQPSDTLVVNGESATFSVSATSPAPYYPPTYQWYRNGQPIAGATRASLKIPVVVSTDDGSMYTCAVANSFGVVQSRQATLTVESPVLGPTFLVSPADNASGEPTKPTFVWHRLIGADTYHLQVLADSAFTLVARQDSTIVDTTDTGMVLQNATCYFWRVAAKNVTGKGPWSTARRLATIIALPDQVTLKEPANGDTLRTDSVAVVWYTVMPEVDRYRVAYAVDSLFTSPTVDSAVVDTVWVARNLVHGERVWWRVQAHNSVGWGPWSAAAAFVVDIPVGALAIRHAPERFSIAAASRTGYVTYSLPRAGRVLLRAYSLDGCLLANFVNGWKEAGWHTVAVRPPSSAAGAIVLEFRAGSLYRKQLLVTVK